MAEYRSVVVVGAGASGMAAAIAAAQSGAQVCMLEALPKAGRSVMAAGNGRCNFANADLSPERYNDPPFVAATMGSEPLTPILDFFEALGLWYVADDEGRLFPRSRAAASVLDVLLTALAERSVELRLESPVVAVEPWEQGWQVETAAGEIVQCAALLWAAGGGTAQTAAQGTGIPLVAERVALCPLATSPQPKKPLDGVRAACSVELRDGETSIASRSGEVLFRSYGLSGIAIFDLSRLARSGDRLVLDLLPDVDEVSLQRLLEARIDRHPCTTPRQRLGFLDGALHPKIARHLMERVCGKEGARPIDISQVARSIKAWEFDVTGTADESHGQVTQGGLATHAFDPLTLEARTAPGFFASGEALDIDGECGGLNLAWAWSSGMVAGVAAARRACGC